MHLASPHRVFNARRGLALSLLSLAALGAIPLRAEIARRADDLVASIGINTHLNSSQYYNQTTFGDLGVRHFRDNLPATTTSTGFHRLGQLYASHGIRGLMVCDNTTYSPADRQLVMEQDRLESIEGLNEPDLFGPRSYLTFTDDITGNDYSATIAFQNDLYAAMKANPATQNKPVLSPAMAAPALSSVLQGCDYDIAAFHWYEGGGPPISGKLTSAVYPQSRLIEAPGGATKPMMMTEVGWISPFSGSYWTSLSDAAAAKYIPRLLADTFDHSILRTYLFEMTDTPGYYNYGLVRNDGSVKPAYTTVKNLISLLGEATWNTSSQLWQQPPAFTPVNLDYTLSSSTSRVRHLLLQKSNGDYYLLLWQDVRSFDYFAGQDINVPPVTVKLAFNTPIQSASTYLLQSTAATATYAYPNTLSLSVPDEIMVVKLSVYANPPNVPSPAVTLYAHDVEGLASQPGETASFSVYRSGGTSSPLTVNYTLGGTAINGTHYDTLSGYVTIPAGAVGAGVNVVPKGLVDINGKKTVVATLAPGAYNIGYRHITGEVALVTGDDMIDDFNDGNVAGWTTQTHSAVSHVSAPADQGSGALRWTFTNTGAAWNNMLMLTFATPQDWSTVSDLHIRFAEDAANPASDKGQFIYFDIKNNNTSTSGGAGITCIGLSNEPGYRTIKLHLGGFARNQVNSIRFYADGSKLAAGVHRWYIDGVRTAGGDESLLEDFEKNTAAWTTQSRSTLALNTASPDSGVRDGKWIYNDDGINSWGNEIRYNYGLPQDLTSYRKLVLRFATDPANPASDIGKSVFFDYVNDGGSVSGGASVDSWIITTTTKSYRTIELDLGSYPRNKVTLLKFYVHGGLYSTGNHIWYLDNLTLR